MTRTAECACGRVNVTVQNEPLAVATCHCDFCQKRTGSVFQVGAYYARDVQIDVSGETKAYNGLEIDGIGNASGESVTYHFCPICGSTLYWHKEGQSPMLAIAVGNFVDPGFPAPVIESHVEMRHHWVSPVSGAVPINPHAD